MKERDKQIEEKKGRSVKLIKLSGIKKRRKGGKNKKIKWIKKGRSKKEKHWERKTKWNA